MSNPNRRVALIAGPTASGKTALALHLAKSRDVVIINADSSQVYSDLPILSAQPTADEQTAVPHRLFGYLDGATACSAARWAKDAKAEITTAHSVGKLPVLVGGTGLYLQVLLDGIAPIPEIDPTIRAEIRALGVADSYRRLQQADPAMARLLGPTDGSRICRALEVIESTDRSIADWRKEKSGGIAGIFQLHPFILLPPREWLYARCDVRFDQMMESGAVDEVRALLARGLPADVPVMRAIGVREIAAMLAGQIAQADVTERGKIATRQYAKRQFTWFRNQTPSEWPIARQEINDSNFKEFETLLQF